MSDNPFNEDVEDVELPMLTKKEENKPEIPKAQQGSNSSGKSADLQEKLRQLKAREAELTQRQARINQTKAEIIPAVNWPTFFPIVRYNLDGDIPQNAHKCVKYCLYGLVSFIIHAVYNVFAVLFVKGLPTYSTSKNIVFAVIQGFAGTYFVTNFSYRKLYSSCANHDIPFQFTLMQFITIGWVIYLVIGFPDSGSVGFAVFLDLLSLSSSAFSKIVAFINLLILAATLFCEFNCLIEAQKYQKVSGADQHLLNQSPETPNPQ